MIKFIKEIGMRYQAPTSTTKRMMVLVECSGCGKQYPMQKGQFKAGYTSFCKDCKGKTDG